MRASLLPIALLILQLAFLVTRTSAQQTEFDAYDYNRRLGQSINLGNTLEAPNEGDWGFSLSRWHFEKIAEGGFDSVRVPIKWSGHANATIPYTIDTTFFERIDWVIDQAKSNDLAVILDVHHYDEIHSDIDGHRDRLAGLWSQIAERYRDEPTTSVFFEILNEPNDDFTSTRWRQVMEESLAAIRESNPDRQVIVGGHNWNSASGLSQLRLPEDDHNLIGTFHYYSPFEFTHQGAEWANNSDEWLGTTWDGTTAEENAIGRDFDLVQNWSERFDRPVLVGEFGAYRFGDMDSRARWTEAVTSAAEERDYSWSYWEFGAGFGVINRSSRRWVEPLYEALSPTSLMNLDGEPGLTVGDVDLLSSAIAFQTSETRYDIDGDGQVTSRDLDYWIFFSNNLPGDIDLDGDVDFPDFLQLSASFGAAAAWSGGDMTGDGRVGFDDFLRLSANFGVAVAGQIQTPSVPEPNTPSSLACVVVSLLLVRRRR